jgi:YfiH family protein
MLQPITAADLAALPGLAHGFFTRQGGISQGIFSSLNCGLGSTDDPIAVRENRARVAAHLGAFDVITAHQVHSATAIVADRAWSPDQRPRVDAIVTATPGLAVGVLSADCAPILFADQQARVVAAAHAGWRGAVGGIAEATIAAMLELGARKERIRAAVGPCIGPAVYEVGPDFQADVLARDPESAEFFRRLSPGAREHFDLPGYVANRLLRAEISVDARPALCTYDGDALFFSYRRSRAQKNLDYGRQISAIVLT